MDETDRALDGLRSICRYCREVSFAVHRFGDKEVFLSDYAYQATCAFSIQQIGEIVKSNYGWLRSESPGFNWRGFARFRDFAAHNYHNVDYDALWEAVINDVPLIWNEAVRILDDHTVSPSDECRPPAES